jgi:hypothetical protein
MGGSHFCTTTNGARLSLILFHVENAELEPTEIFSVFEIYEMKHTFQQNLRVSRIKHMQSLLSHINYNMNFHTKFSGTTYNLCNSFLFFVPEPNRYLAVLTSFLLGFSDGCFNTQVRN